MPTSIIPIPKARDAAGHVNQPVRIDPGETPTRILNPSNITVYYKSTDTVSDTSNDGTLTQGQTLVPTTTEYLLGAERTEVVLDSNPTASPLSFIDRRRGHRGHYCPDAPLLGTPAFAANVQNRFFLGRHQAQDATPITKIGFYVSTAGAADDPVQVALGTISGTTWTKVAASASTTGILTSTGRKEIALSTPFTPNPGTSYYAGVIVNSADATLRIICYQLGGATPFQIFGTGGEEDINHGTGSIPLGATVTVGGTATTCPILTILYD